MFCTKACPVAMTAAERSIRELRDLTRRRAEVVVARGQEAQRLEKELEDTGMKLTSVLTDVTGLSSRRILDALIGGERDVDRLAELTFGAARKKIPALVEALDGTFTDHHAFMCRHYLDQIDHLDYMGAGLDAPDRVKMVTGDRVEIARQIAGEVGIGEQILDSSTRTRSKTSTARSSPQGSSPPRGSPKWYRRTSIGSSKRCRRGVTSSG